jgi:hypothetical protein
MDVDFKAHLGELGIEIVSKLHETKSWLKTVMEFPNVHPNVFAGITDDCNVIPFSPHSSLKEIPSSKFNAQTGEWEVCCCFKWKCSVDTIIKNFLEHVIVDPTVMRVNHDLWDNEKSIIIHPINMNAS